MRTASRRRRWPRRRHGRPPPLLPVASMGAVGETRNPVRSGGARAWEREYLQYRNERSDARASIGVDSRTEWHRVDARESSRPSIFGGARLGPRWERVLTCLVRRVRLSETVPGTSALARMVRLCRPNFLARRRSGAPREGEALATPGSRSHVGRLHSPEDGQRICRPPGDTLRQQ